MSAHVAEEAAVRKALAQARAEGRRIVFTNGTFDLLHGGHLRVLAGAAELGDVLVVAVNDDESVRRLRGPAKPVVPGAERAALVAALGGVDHVLLFADDTVDRLLEVLGPDVHAKGTDYDERTLPERKTNARLGIQMAFVGGAKERSASSLLARVAAAAEAADRVRAWPRKGRDPASGQGVVQSRAQAFLSAHAAQTGEDWLDLERLVSTSEGVLVEGTAKRWVRRIVVAGTPLYVKVTVPYERKRDPRVEFEHHLTLRAAGFRAPEPWLALRGDVAGRSAGVLVTREAPGKGLDEWLRYGLGSSSPRARLALAAGIGRAVRALHAARFLFPDLQAWHLLVDGSPVGGRSALTFIDLMRLERASKDVTPALAAPGLAALALSLRPVSTTRFRLAVLRAYLGGSLREARPWLSAISRRIQKVKDRGTFRHLSDASAQGVE